MSIDYINADINIDDINIDYISDKGHCESLLAKQCPEKDINRVDPKFKCANFFVTINPNLKKKKYEKFLTIHPLYMHQYITKQITTLFKKYRILQYFFIPEFAKTTGRYHLHGMVDIDNAYLLNVITARLRANIGNTDIQQVKNEIKCFQYCTKSKGQHPLNKIKVGPYYDNIKSFIKNERCKDTINAQGLQKK